MDCICINQADADERAQQVKIMHEIYRRAKSVLVWLGEEAEDSAMAMEYTARLDAELCMKEAISATYEPAAYNSALRTKSSLFDNMLESKENVLLLNALIALVKRPWLRRAWAQQEAAMCVDTRVICDHHEISRNQFYSLFWLLIRRDSLEWPEWTNCTSLSIEASLTAAESIQTSHISVLKIPSPYSDHDSLAVPFYNLIRKCLWCEATDPRDKVFALYSLADLSSPYSDTRDRPRIDYKVSWQNMYTKLAQ